MIEALDSGGGLRHSLASIALFYVVNGGDADERDQKQIGGEMYERHRLQSAIEERTKVARSHVLADTTEFYAAILCNLHSRASADLRFSRLSIAMI